ncbi:dipeptidase [Nostoc sp. GT001]|uniref:dipeptidase n=1 Tax=Nostoc sp. GT001 TaxID=3056647 RepID=UPI0025AA8A38|nr:dipeptidase [Nostoc sp. GT001]MDM9580110.1 dipeptidase [Nostoc sp. GT001]
MLSSFSTNFAPLDYSQQTQQRSRWLSQITQLIAFPTISAQPKHRRDLQACAQWLARHLAELGLHNVQILPGIKGSIPSVYGDWLHAPGKPTLLLYGHYDVQPVDPLGAWQTPPFQATIIGENLYGRGASDDKGQFFIHLKAIESYLRTTGKLPLNIKVWLEGEEEISSPNLSAFLKRETSRLKADAVLVSDTEMLGRDRPSIIYGLRGNLSCELEVTGPRHDLHSGRYGGAVLNPLQGLSDIISGLHDRKGRVAIPGFYQQVRKLEPTERQTIRCCCKRDQQILDDLDLPAGWGEPGYSLYERMTIRPALTINGLAGGYTGLGSKAVIPNRSLARLSIRLVPDQDPADVAQLLQRHIQTLTHPAIRSRLKITGGARSVLLPKNHPVMTAVIKAIKQTWGVTPVFTRSGGTIPLVEQLYRRLGVPIVLLGFGLPDDNIHAPNEKISLSNFFQGIETVIQFLAEYGR